MWEKFYTPKEIAKLMVDLISNSSPKNAIDICVGSWNLLEAASTQWDDLELYGVDIDKNKKLKTDTCFFCCMDGRKYALKSIKNRKYFSLVLANPPFGYENIKHNSTYSKLPGYENIDKKALNRIETTMILANLALLKEGGDMVIIVPKTMITGEKYCSLRKYIGKNYLVKFFVFLPDHIFGRDISTVILVLKNTKRTNEDISKQYELIGTKPIKLVFKKDLKMKLIKNGIWQNDITLRNNIEEGLIIKRGSINNSLLYKDGQYPVIHSTDIEALKNGKWCPTRYVSDYSIYNKSRIAEYGDILMIRVGRNCGLTIRIKKDMSIPFSDCIYVIKHTDKNKLNLIWNILKSPQYLMDLDKLKEGLSTSYITIKKLEAYLLSEIENIIY